MVVQLLGVKVGVGPAAARATNPKMIANERSISERGVLERLRLSDGLRLRERIKTFLAFANYLYFFCSCALCCLQSTMEMEKGSYRYCIIYLPSGAIFLHD